MTPTRFLAPLVPLALLTACGGGSADDDERSASGEVLEGTISDEMLPLDQLQSEPPLLEPEPAPGARQGGEEVADDAEGAEEPPEDDEGIAAPDADEG